MQTLTRSKSVKRATESRKSLLSPKANLKSFIINQAFKRELEKPQPLASPKALIGVGPLLSPQPLK